ncbi:ferric reductase NAD binding domain-containing protein [Mycena alexandri]|uniref:Ferric reductase NAD binding domain-containing protein n=1 Tax=Mycena alexandri TaxID=1745969 RepID=A0AAD6T984_9AGAR|nr:ferric reductase NAD binding domain-containing protein [Mycena alexandri]
MDPIPLSAIVAAQKPDPDRIPRILLANLYPKQVWYFMAAFIALVSLIHFISVLHAHATRKHAPPTSDDAVILRHGVSWSRLPLATLNLFRTLAFRWSITVAGAYTLNVADFLLAGMYLAVIFTWTFINSKNLEGMKYDPKYWANRCAHIAASQLPLMTAFGMKNNPISFLTGISFDKARWLGLLEHLHRVMARVICVMLWVHASGRVILDLSDDTTTHWHIGVLGASALTLLCLLSVRPLRSRSYELFLVLHLTLGVLALAAAYKHSSDFGYGSYIWPAFFLWGLDRFLRLTRISLINSRLFGKSQTSTPRTITSPATVSVLSSHFLRIAIDVPPHFGWRAGQSAYLTIYGAYGSSITEAHPFTIANCSAGAWSGDGAKLKDEENSTEEIAGDGSTGAIDAAGEKNSDTGNELNAPAHESGHLTFILRVRNGFTRRLREAVLAAPESTTTGVGKSFKAFVDGPYGSPPDVRGFETVVFICGGSGVSFTLPLFLDLIHGARAHANPRCKRVVFVWAIREPDQIIWIADALGAALLQRSSSSGLNAINIEIKLHITSAPEDTQVQSLDADSSVASDLEAAAATIGTDEKVSSNPTVKAHLLELPNVNLIYGRPDIGGILGGEIAAAARGAVSISVCGTTELADGVRQALRGGSGMAGLGMFERFVDVLRGGPSVVLHVEGFGSG